MSETRLTLEREQEIRAKLEALISPTGKGEQHCHWCGRRSYIGDAETEWHHDYCPSFIVRQFETALTERTRELDDLKAENGQLRTANALLLGGPLYVQEERLKAERQIEEFWAEMRRGWHIEGREFFEREYKAIGFSSAMTMAMHHMWKRDRNVEELTARADAAEATLRAIKKLYGTCEHFESCALCSKENPDDPLCHDCGHNQADHDQLAALLLLASSPDAQTESQ